MTEMERRLLANAESSARSAMRLAKFAFGVASSALALVGYCLGHG